MDGWKAQMGREVLQSIRNIHFHFIIVVVVVFSLSTAKAAKNSSLLLLLLLLLAAAAAAAMMYSVIQHKTCADHTPVLMCLLGNNSRFLLCLLLLPDRILHCEGFLVSFFIIPSAAGSFCCCQVKLFE